MNTDTTAAGMEILNMHAGFRALPVDPDTKAPFPFVTPHGVKDATDDPIILQQWMAVSGDAGLGLVPGHGFAIIDDDAGELDVSTYGLRGTFGERTRRGVHHWAQIPEGRRLRKSRLRDATGDLITGDRAYVVVSPTPPYVPIDIDAPILGLPDDSPLWEIAAPQKTPGTSHALNVTAQDLADARNVMERLHSGTCAETVALILEGRWQERYPSRSEADAALAFMASHFVRGNPRRAHILTAMLEAHSPKAHSHRNPTQYIQTTVKSAMSGRDDVDSDQRAFVFTQFVVPCLSSPGPGLPGTQGPKPKGVYDAKFLLRRDRKGVLDSVILGFAASSEIDTFTRNDRWRRFPVQFVADIFGVTREAIRLRLVALEDRGQIERQIPAYTHDGRVRRDSLIRACSHADMEMTP